MGPQESIECHAKWLCEECSSTLFVVCSFRPPGKGNPYQFYDSPPTVDIPDFLSRPQEQEGLIITPEIFSVENKHPFIVEDLSKAVKRPEAAAQVAT